MGSWRATGKMQTARWKPRKSGSRNYGDDVADRDMQAVDIIDGSIEGVGEGCGPS